MINKIDGPDTFRMDVPLTGCMLQDATFVRPLVARVVRKTNKQTWQTKDDATGIALLHDCYSSYIYLTRTHAVMS